MAYRIPGIHVEGPYVSSEDGPRGAHDLRYVREASISELEEWLDASKGLLAVVTFAPEVPGVAEAIAFLRKKGVRVALGHHAGSAEDIDKAVGLGASLSTHLGNGSHAQLPRLDNYIRHQLGDDRLSASIISDGFHLPYSVLRVFARATGWPLAETIRLVTEVPLSFLLGNRESLAGSSDARSGVKAGEPLDLVRFGWNERTETLNIREFLTPDRDYRVGAS